MANPPTPKPSAGRIPTDDDTMHDDVPPQGPRAGGRTGLLPRPGEAVFHNRSDDAVKFTIRDEGNRPHRVTCDPGGHTVVPVEYADIVPKRAPQLVEIARAPRPRVEED